MTSKAVHATSIHVLDARPKFPYRIVAKRYILVNSDPHGQTLILTHGIGFHKETWEPSLEHLLKLACDRGVLVREVWSIDSPNHGDAAVLNEKEIKRGFPNIWHWENYAHAINTFLTSFEGHYFRDHRLVGVGHSVGTVAFILSTTYTAAPRFEQMIFVETMINDPDYQKELKLSQALVKQAQSRHDVWRSTQEAYDWLKKTKPSCNWHPEILQLYCEHALRPIRPEEFPGMTSGVTLKCPKSSEAACYTDQTSKFQAFFYFPHLCSEIPIHLIYGGIPDFLTKSQQESTVVAADGRLKSVQRVSGAGHLIVQTHPHELAVAVATALSSSPRNLKPNTAGLCKL